MYELLKHAHSGWRWIVLIALVAAIANAFMRRSASEFEAKDKKLALFALIATHLQLVFGLLLYFIGERGFAFTQIEGFMKVPELRFHAVEHIAVMILSVILITVGYSRSKRGADAGARFRSVWLWYGIGLVLMLSRIPWPFQTAYGGGWF